MKVGMIAEATCAAKPFTILPMVVSQVQNVIAAGQLARRPADRHAEPEPARHPHRVSRAALRRRDVGVPPGSSCIANAYTNNHDALADPGIGTGRWLFLHVVDTVGLVHAMILRMQAMMLPVQTLVLGGH